MISTAFVNRCVANTISSFDLMPCGIGECDDCREIGPLFAVSSDDQGAWAVCARCARGGN